MSIGQAWRSGRKEWESPGTMCFAAIKYEKEFLESHGYWYTVVNDFKVTDEFCQMIKEKIIAKYGEWNA